MLYVIFDTIVNSASDHIGSIVLQVWAACWIGWWTMTLAEYLVKKGEKEIH